MRRNGRPDHEGSGLKRVSAAPARPEFVRETASIGRPDGRNRVEIVPWTNLSVHQGTSEQSLLHLFEALRTSRSQSLAINSGALTGIAQRFLSGKV